MGANLIKICDFNGIDCESNAHIFISSGEIVTPCDSQECIYDIAKDRIIVNKKVDRDLIILYIIGDNFPPPAEGYFMLSQIESTPTQFVYLRKFNNIL